MSLPTISATEALRLVQDGARLIDIREQDEHARERVKDAASMPLSRIANAEIDASARIVLFHCKSGMRTQSASAQLAAKAGDRCEAYIVEGGLEALKKAGASVLRDSAQPLELQRQVQIGAGGLALGGTLLGVFLHPGFFAVPAFVGAGLMFAGLTGFCGMARLLVKAPWNSALKA